MRIRRLATATLLVSAGYASGQCISTFPSNEAFTGATVGTPGTLVNNWSNLAGDDPRVRARARQIAFDEARRRAGAHLIQPEIDLQVRSQGSIVRFALDVEATVRRNP